MNESGQKFTMSCEALEMRASLLPLDQKVFGFPVAAITFINVNSWASAQLEFAAFKLWVDLHSYAVVSCRLLHSKLRESFFLEENGFRFVEMVLHPKISDLEQYKCDSSGLDVDEAQEVDVELIASMAQRCFKYERFHIDPRLSSDLGDNRYAFWVRNSYLDPNQKLLKICSDNEIVGFFVIEERDRKVIYWHLTAINPSLTEHGMGFKVWMAMIEYHKKNGFLSIETTISARNPVINLYSKLNFRFDMPDMTFHWVKPKLVKTNFD